MFMILIHHFAYHGTFNGQQFDMHRASVQVVYNYLLIIGKAGVVAFVLIGAYFLSDKKFNFNRPVNLMIQTIFYSFVIYYVVITWFPNYIKPIKNVDMWLPFPLPSNYWFVISYIVMLFLMPILNMILNNFTQQKLLLIISFLFLIWNVFAIIGNIFPGKIDNINFTNYTESNYFCELYLIAGYIRRYNPNWSNSLFITGISFIISAILPILLIISLNNKNMYNVLTQNMAVLNNPFSLFMGVTLFVMFKNINIGRISIINYIANSMFGVYLIHDNSFVRIILWKHLINSQQYIQNWQSYLLMGLYYSFLVFIICILIDCLKRIIFNKALNYVSDKLSYRFNKLTKII